MWPDSNSILFKMVFCSFGTVEGIELCYNGVRRFERELPRFMLYMH